MSIIDNMIIERAISSELGERLRTSPAVALVEPRQCGKTTTARGLDGEYFDLGQPGDRFSKDFWRGTGLLHALHGVTDRDDLLSRPWTGASWEGCVIEQAIGVLNSRGVHCSPWYFRTSDRYEIDLLHDFGKQLWAVEMKLTSPPSSADMNRLAKVADMTGATHQFLVSQTTKPTDGDLRASYNLDTFLERIASV